MVIDPLVVLSLVFGLATMVAYGIQSYMASVLTKKDNAIRIIFWYYLFSSILLAVIALLFFSLPQLSLFDDLAFVVLSVISVTAFLAFYKGVHVGKVSVIAPISNSWSAIAVLVGILFLKESITPFLGIGIALTILGTILTSLRLKDLEELNFKGLVPGAKYAFATMLGWGTLYTSIGILSKQLGWFWPIMIITVGSTIVVFIFSLFGKVKMSYPAKLTGLMPLYVIVGTAGFLFYSLGTNMGYVSVVGPLAAAAPFITIVLARVLTKERLDPHQIVGIACILLGIIILAL